jgi:hypothetical protein
MKLVFSSSSLRSHIWCYPEKQSNKAIMSQLATELSIWLILARGKLSLGQHLLRSVKSMHIRHFSFFLRTIIMLANHCRYVTSLRNPASNRRFTSAFASSIFSSDIFRSFCFLGFAFGLTCSLCSINCLLTPIKSEVDQAKTSLFLSRNYRSFACSSGLISAPMHTVLLGTLGLSATLVKSPPALIAFLNSTDISCLGEGCSS